MSKTRPSDVLIRFACVLPAQIALSAELVRLLIEYVRFGETNAFYPEIILNLRDSSYVQFASSQKGKVRFGVLTFARDPRTAGEIVISRMDGLQAVLLGDAANAS